MAPPVFSLVLPLHQVSDTSNLSEEDLIHEQIDCIHVHFIALSVKGLFILSNFPSQRALLSWWIEIYLKPLFYSFVQSGNTSFFITTGNQFSFTIHGPFSSWKQSWKCSSMDEFMQYTLILHCFQKWSYISASHNHCYLCALFPPS